ncbi:MAG: COX15/CtaA family protein, partial [Saprospiraceae bacterium]|nr:COX15/CtaA family protein [Saprospiraceae bacterium]
MENRVALKKGYPTIVKAWLIIGLFMLVMQVVIGGITRLTGSGLSITKWEIVTGAMPPLNEAAWMSEFDLYKATPQYQKINEGMSLSEFKFIYFWEYLHRLWARTMGFVFLIPFLIFWRKGYIDKPLMKRLGIVVLLAAIVAAFGWIMVASGLVDRPWVNAYKLTLHLSLALVVFGYLLWTTFFTYDTPKAASWVTEDLKGGINILFGLVIIQIMLGGLMSGMHAALVYPTWPLMHDSFLPGLIFEGE